MEEIAKSGTLRRLLAFVIGSVVVLLNQKLGLHLDAAEAVGFAGLVATYIIQSAAKEAAVKKAALDKIHLDARQTASDQVRDLDGALKQLNSRYPKPAEPVTARPSISTVQMVPPGEKKP